MNPIATLTRIANFIFPYFANSTVTQVFVWRHGLALQLHLADTVRNGKTGHYYEFGVFRLRSIINFNTVRKLAALRSKKFDAFRIFAFDSFEGLPSSTAEDVADPDWHQGAYEGSLENVTAIAKSKGIHGIEFIKGFYEDSLTPELAAKMREFPPGLVHIDCDLYSSTITVLRWLDKLSLPGSIYFFDDLWKYHGHPDAGELKAIHEYNNDKLCRGMLIEDPLSLGSGMVYRFCPRDPSESTAPRS